MIVINGSVTEELKEHLLAGGTHPVARIHGNLIIAGGNFTGRREVEIKITGDETFTFSSSSKAVYFMNPAFANLTREDIISVECTHFTYGSGNVLAEMNDGEFIFNITTATGLTTGNVSFKNSGIFTSLGEATAWFKAQYEKGTPVIVTAYIKD